MFVLLVLYVRTSIVIQVIKRKKNIPNLHMKNEKKLSVFNRLKNVVEVDVIFLELRCEIDYIRLKVLYLIFRELSNGISGLGFCDFEFSSNFGSRGFLLVTSVFCP